MFRSIHAYVALIGSLLLLVTALSGSILAIRPATEVWQFHQANHHQSVAQIIQLIAERNPRAQVQDITVEPSGLIKVNYSIRNNSRIGMLDLQTGRLERIPNESDFFIWINKLHRQFLLGEPGRWITAFNGLVMTILLISGFVILIRRLGGIRYLFTKQSWQNMAGFHSSLSRWTIIPLTVTALTALWLSAVTLHIAPTGDETPPHYPESLKKLEPVPAWTLHTLRHIPFSQVRSITYPEPEDWFDVWAVKTSHRYHFVDQFTGDQLKLEQLPWAARVNFWVRLLHTAEGAWYWGLPLMLGSLSIPFLSITGIIIWLHRRRHRRGIHHNNTAHHAEVLILIGSENGTTWGFGKALHQAFIKNGIPTRIQEMNALASYYPKLKNLIILSSTYGDGDSPANANRFLKRLDNYRGAEISYAVLAFGDRSFNHFAAFGKRIDQTLNQKFKSAILPLTCVDKCNRQTFENWCQDLAKALNISLSVHYQAPQIKAKTLFVQRIQYYGQVINTPITQIRLQASKLPPAKAGDYVAIYAPNTQAPRLYSVASDTRHDQCIDICVRQQTGGICSTWLSQLCINDAVKLITINNPRFHLPKKAPIVLMIATGTGIAPFMGMIRHHKQKQQKLILYWGGRHPEHDALYADEIQACLADGRLSEFHPAWSRIENPQYVQDMIVSHANQWQQYLKQGAVVMVCGNQMMAQEVESIMQSWLVEMGSSIEQLRKSKRYLEDIY